MGKWFSEEDELPLFPEEVYDHLPPFLDSVIRSAISSSDREVLLIGAITVLSSTLSNVCAAYDSRTVYPNLYLFVSADAGMGKGALTLCRELVAPINAELRAIAKQQAESAGNEKDKGKDKEKEVPMLALIIPANCRASREQSSLLVLPRRSRQCLRTAARARSSRRWLTTTARG